MIHRDIIKGVSILVLVAACAVSCEDLDNSVDTAQTKIQTELNRQYVWERGNLPDDPEPEKIEGYYDIVRGAYRYIVNEYVSGSLREGRENAPEINTGDSISFYFDARIYSGSFDGSQTFYTNIAARRAQIAGSNPDFDTETVAWPVIPLRIKIGDDARILKSLQTALLSCRAGVRAPETDPGETDPGEEQWSVASDIVRIYLTSDIAFGDKTVYNVPGGSTLVFQVTDIEIISE